MARKGAKQEMRPIDADEFKSILTDKLETNKKMVKIFEEINMANKIYLFKGKVKTIEDVIEKLDNQPTVNEWIMCFEKLPSAFERVKACDAEGNIEEGFIEKIGNHVICKLGNCFCLDYVVAWMPLPEK